MVMRAPADIKLLTSKTEKLKAHSCAVEGDKWPLVQIIVLVCCMQHKILAGQRDH